MAGGIQEEDDLGRRLVTGKPPGIAIADCGLKDGASRSVFGDLLMATADSGTRTAEMSRLPFRARRWPTSAIHLGYFRFQNMSERLQAIHSAAEQRDRLPQAAPAGFARRSESIPPRWRMAPAAVGVRAEPIPNYLSFPPAAASFTDSSTAA